MTIFTIPKPFEKKQDIRIQQNAIESWLENIESVEVFLCGDDKGVEEYARKVDVRHIGSIERNNYGTPLVSDAFDKVTTMSTNDVLMYVNCDIIFSGGLDHVVESVQNFANGEYLIVGRRIDTDIDFRIDFTDEEDIREMSRAKQRNGSLHSYTGIDYFVFRKGHIPKLPDFAVGRPGWDNWLIYTSKEEGIPVFDATKDIEAVHQNHEEVYDYDSDEVKDNFSKNQEELDDGRKLADIRHADWIVDNGKITRPLLWRRIYSYITMSNAVGRVLSIKRKLEWSYKK